MKAEYLAWIVANGFDNEAAAYGRCAETTDAMVVEFPELARVRGHYFDRLWGRREHWWCISPDGEIVDPTAAQFPSRGTGRYVQWIEGSPEPTGKCHNCGAEVFGGANFCDEECEAGTMKAMGFTRKVDGAWTR